MMFFARLKNLESSDGSFDATLLVPVSEETPPDDSLAYIPTAYGTAECCRAEWVLTADIAQDSDVRDIDPFTTRRLNSEVMECLPEQLLLSELADLVSLARRARSTT